MTENIDHPVRAREHAVALLRQHGISVTPQRVTIGEILFARDQHMSADAVMRSLDNHAVRVSKATVYNTLNLFAEKGMVKEISLDTRRVFYDSNVEPHHHFFNVDTGVLTDFSPESVEFRSLPELPEGTETDGVEVVIRVRNRR